MFCLPGPHQYVHVYTCTKCHFQLTNVSRCFDTISQHCKFCFTKYLTFPANTETNVTHLITIVFLISARNIL